MKLHGIAVSNYYNCAKLALLEKNIEFEEVNEMPRQEDAFMAKSPMGKVPCLEVDGNFLTETNVIFDLLDDLHPEPALYPADPFARAKAKEILHYIELYVDLPARRHLPTLYFGAPINEAALAEARPALENGLRALRQLASFDPFLTGPAFSYADISALFHFGFAGRVGQSIYDWDIVAEVPGLQACLDQVAARPAAKQVLADMEAGMAAFAGN